MELTGVHWLIIAAAAGGLATLAVTRPWRFMHERRSCPQCRTLLPRWDRWGWIEVWTCSSCGCQVGR